ncbi:MAG: hypothetical protein LDL07_08140, partial [Desulfarculus sp.]|nr:hypothetical protein [Desulfarculus sp.]
IFTAALFLLPFIYLTRLVIAEGWRGGKVAIGLVVLALAMFGLSHQAVNRLRGMRRQEYKIK